MFHKVNYNINEEINGRDYSNSILLIIYYFIKIKYLSELTREKNQQKIAYKKSLRRGFFYNVSELYIKPLNVLQLAPLYAAQAPYSPHLGE